MRMRDNFEEGRGWRCGRCAGPKIVCLAGMMMLIFGLAGVAGAGVSGAPAWGLSPAVVFTTRTAGASASVSRASHAGRTQPCLTHATLQTSITALVQPFMAKWPGAALTIGILDETTSAVLGFGHMGPKSETPPGPRTVYEIGSITKVFTATCLELLAERGRVGLEDPVQQYYDAAKVKIPEYQGKKITLLHLTSHASGLPRMPKDFFVKTALKEAVDNPYSAYSPDDVFDFLKQCKLPRAPGAQVEYSNLGVGLLGLTLARREGVSYESLVGRLVCEPLGLRDTVITLAPEQQARLAPPFTSRGALWGLIPADTAANWTFQDSFAGAGALRSTAGDMLHFLAVNVGLTSSPIAGALQKTHAFRVKENEGMSMGMGWIRTPLKGMNEPVIWHNGGTGGYRSFIAFHPGVRAGVVVLSNTTDDEVDEIGFKALKMMVRLAGGK